MRAAMTGDHRVPAPEGTPPSGSAHISTSGWTERKRASGKPGQLHTDCAGFKNTPANSSTQCLPFLLGLFALGEDSSRERTLKQHHGETHKGPPSLSILHTTPAPADTCLQAQRSQSQDLGCSQNPEVQQLWNPWVLFQGVMSWLMYHVARDNEHRF